MTTTTRKRSAPKPARKRKSGPPLWEIGEILRRLEPEYGPPKPPRGYDPVSELVYTILSQHTSDTNSIRAYDSLVAAFPSWEAVAAADPDAVADAIRGGGLARVKAPRIQAILREVKSRAGEYDLSFLSAMGLEEAKAWLRELARRRPEDRGLRPHVLAQHAGAAGGHPRLPGCQAARPLRREGQSPTSRTTSLEAQIEPADRMPFHMLTIQHGRVVCKAMRPRCEACVLEERCPASALKPPAGKKRRRADG